MESAHLLEESNPYLVAQPNEVLRLLQAIQQEQSFVTMSLPEHPNVLTVLLEIDERAGHFLFDVGRNRAETQAVLSTRHIHFSSSLKGVAVRFTTPTPTETMFEGAPAFRSPLPTDLEYLQRREHYRSKVIAPAVCTAKLANGKTIRLTMADLSLGGVRLQSREVTPEMLPVGTVLQDVLLDFLQMGKVDVTLTIASQQTVEFEGISTYYYGCHIQKLPRTKEATVQKLVFALDVLNRPNTRSTR
jgi:c-di-GMP-binding flagellar brake protein YcgR